MSGPRWWDSFDRMDAVFRVSLNTAIAAATVAAVCWIATLTAVAVVGTVVATTAILLTLFSWFRRDDLAHGGRPPR